jgi:hypothetical protein
LTMIGTTAIFSGFLAVAGIAIPSAHACIVSSFQCGPRGK